MIKSIWNNITKRVNGLIDKIRHKEPWYKYYGNNPRKINYPTMTLYETIEKTAESYPYYDAFMYYGKKITYKEFIIRIKKMASSLLEEGIKEGDVITICMPNTPSAICIFYAVNMVGAVASMIHPLSSEKEIELYLNTSNSKYIMTIDLVYDKIIKIIDNTNVSKIIVSSVSDDMDNAKHAIYWFMSGRKTKIAKNNKAILLKDFLKKGIYYKDLKPVKRKNDDDAVILYSGGTTGNPKGIVLTNLNFNALAMQAHIMTEAKAGETILSIMPIFHGFGLGVSVHTPLYIGMTCIFVPDFSPKKFDNLIRKYHPNFITGVPTLYEGLLKNRFKPKELSCIKVAISGGDTLSVELKNRVDEFFKNHGSKAELRSGYGLTESTAAVCLTPTKYYKPNIIGMPFPDMTIKIVQIGTTEEVNVMEEGEICVNGPTVMKKYLNNENETKTTLIKHNDGKYWLHTGDIGYMDTEGFVYFKQRLKRLIISSGYNIYPSYVEEIICRHPRVESCVVIGIPHEYKKQVVKAYIVLNGDKKADKSTKKSIKKYCEDNLAKYSWPYEYEYRDSLPTTLVGKVAYKKLEEENSDK